jgi:hypothetical protein
MEPPFAHKAADRIVENAGRGTATGRVDRMAGSDPPGPVGALSLWHEELRRRYCGQDPARPATWRCDALYRAAICEANGSDALRARLPSHATFWFARASSILIEAARTQRRVA